MGDRHFTISYRFPRIIRRVPGQVTPAFSILLAFPSIPITALFLGLTASLCKLAEQLHILSVTSTVNFF